MRRAIYWLVVLVLTCWVPLAAFAAADEAAADEAAVGGDFAPGFVARGLAAQQGKAFDVAGDFTVGGFLGVGTQSPVRSVHLQDHNAVFRMDRDVDTSAFLLVRTAAGNFANVLKSYTVGVNSSGANQGQFVINDLGTAVTGGGSRRVTIGNTGNFGINSSAPTAALQVHGTGSPFLFGLVDGAQPRLTVDTSGLLAINTDVALGLRSATPAGHALTTSSTLLSNITQSAGEEAWLALNGDNALIASPGDGGLGLLSIYDQDEIEVNPAATPRFQFLNDALWLRGVGTRIVASPDVANGSVMTISTAGDEVRMVVDGDANRPLVGGFVYRWFQTGTSGADTLMGADQDGDFGITGTLFENNSFDLAEAFWKDEDGIDAGDVVAVSLGSPDAVVLARHAADPAVLGVASTQPGIVMGGGAFSVKHLLATWGEEKVEIFENSRESLEAEVLEVRPDLVERARVLQSFDAFLAHLGAVTDKAAAKPADLEKMRADYGQALLHWRDDLEAAALERFFEQRFIRLALAGRVPVKADAAYGAIRPGDLLVASPTAGHAMRADDPAPGTVIGKALEALETGRDQVMMLVLMR